MINYTAEDLRETADDILESTGQDEEVIADMLRQAADDVEELAKVKARLEAVVNMLANVNHECRYSNAVSMLKDEYDAILRAARGES